MTLVADLFVDAVLRLYVAIIMAIETLVLWRTFGKVPRGCWRRDLLAKKLLVICGYGGSCRKFG